MTVLILMLDAAQWILDGEGKEGEQARLYSPGTQR